MERTNKEDKMEVGIVEKAYSLYLNLADVRAEKEKLSKIKAKEKVEVCVKVGDVIKDFTYKEFIQRLGFDEE